MGWGVSTVAEMDAWRPDAFHAKRLPVGAAVEFIYRGTVRQGAVVRHTWRKTGIGRRKYSPRVVVSFVLNGRTVESVQPPLEVKKLQPPKIEKAPASPAL